MRIWVEGRANPWMLLLLGSATFLLVITAYMSGPWHTDDKQCTVCALGRQPAIVAWVLTFLRFRFLFAGRTPAFTRLYTRTARTKIRWTRAPPSP